MLGVHRNQAVRVRVPGKVNLFLGVGALRPDGYHDITSVFQAVSVYDDVVARPAERVSVRTAGPEADGVPNDGRNLAWRAAEMLAADARIGDGVALHIRKRIPVAGGMAGGSADAAGTLMACAALWRTGSSRADLATLASRLGADVPFSLSGGTALGTGRGDQLTPVLAISEYHWVFAVSPDGMSTPEVYRELDRLREQGLAPPPAASPAEVLDALRAGDCGRLADALTNDLQPAAVSLRPQLRDVLAAGGDLGALGGVVSGSGPTCAFICAHADAARDLADELDRARVCKRTVVASSPAPGARIGA
jgi:4-diphosphocytidyl-2-C-methyl-D-erythritol kinase